MDLGVTIFSTDRSISPLELAPELEARGFASLFLPEHTHIPTSRRTPPPTGDEVLTEEYRRTLDPTIALAAAASLTSRLRLGTGVALVAQHDTISFAKQLATLDLLSQGRLVLGIGFGWNREEMSNHGVDAKRRREIVREKMLAMQALWSQDVAEFHGEHVDFEACWQWPKPVQQPRPTVLIGGAAGPKLFDAIAEYADGWIPIGGAGVAAALPRLREALAARGRDPEQLRIVPMGVLPDERKLDYYREIGASEVILRIPSASRDLVLPVLDAFARFL